MNIEEMKNIDLKSLVGIIGILINDDMTKEERTLGFVKEC